MTGLLLLTRQREDADEDVGEVEEDVHGDIDGVVERPVEAPRSVQVVDHDGREQHDADHVEDRERELVVHAQQAEHRSAHEVEQDQTEQAGHQRCAPHRQVLRHDRADEPGQQDDTSGQDQGLDHARELVQRDERADHDAHGDRTDEATDHGGHRIIVGVRQEGPTDRHGHAGQDEQQVDPLVGELEVVAERAAERRHPDVQRGEQRDGEHERAAAQRIDAGLSLVVKTSRDTFH